MTKRQFAPSAARPRRWQSEQQSGGKGLRIATLCVLAVIALALICVALLQMISLLRDQKQKEPSPQIEETISLSSEPNTLQTDTEYITDKNIRRVGDSFDHRQKHPPRRRQL